MSLQNMSNFLGRQLTLVSPLVEILRETNSHNSSSPHWTSPWAKPLVKGSRGFVSQKQTIFSSLKGSFLMNNHITFHRRRTPIGSFSRRTQSGNVIEFNNNFVQPVKTAAKHAILVKSPGRGPGRSLGDEVTT